MSTANPNKLKVKDIITVVLLALINVVIFFASSVLYATPITIILMPVFFALLEGIVYDTVTAQGMVFAASVSYPQSDLYVPIRLTFTAGGHVSMETEDLLE